MAMNPNLLNQLVKDRQNQLVREAALERMISQARVEEPTLSVRLRLQLSALLDRLGRRIQPSTVRGSEKPEGLSQSRNRAPASASGI